MKRTLSLVCAFVLFVGCRSFAQADSSTIASYGQAADSPASSSQDAPPPQLPPPASQQRATVQNPPFDLPAFSRMSFGAGISPLGIGLEASTNLNTHLNVRAIGNAFKYNTSFTVNGIPSRANLNLASAGGVLDYYPFRAGFRLSGGILFVNQNQITAASSIAGGDSITLNGQTYYSANANAATGAIPLSGTGTLYLNQMKPGALLTTGWGNHVMRSGHWSVPVEIGVAFVGTPKVAMNLAGWACTDAAQTQCTDVSNSANPAAMAFQSDLSAQITKWNHDLSALSSYPIVSVGIAYSFRVRTY